MKYYDTKLHTQVSDPSDTTIESTDKRVECFFKPLEKDTLLFIDNQGLPHVYSVKIKKPMLQGGKVVESRTLQEEKEELKLVNGLNSKKKLEETDWYVTRKIETGKEIPPKITLEREELRRLAD